MMRNIAEHSANLLINARGASRVSLAPNWRSKDLPSLGRSVEYLRETLESQEFYASIQKIMAHPHRRLEPEREERAITRHFRPDGGFVRQLWGSGPRLKIPDEHPLRNHPVFAIRPTLPTQIKVVRKREDSGHGRESFRKICP